MQINHWDRLGIVKPSLRPAEGFGSRRLYTVGDLVAIEIARRLRELNIGLECLARVMRGVRVLWASRATSTMPGVVLIHADGTCVPVPPDTPPAAMLGAERAAILLDIAGVVQDLHERLPAMAPSALRPPEPPRRASPAGARPAKPAPAPSPVPAERRRRASSWGEDW